MQTRKQQKRRVDKGKHSLNDSQLLTESEIKKECNTDSYSDEDQNISMQKIRKEMEVLVKNADYFVIQNFVSVLKNYYL